MVNPNPNKPASTGEVRPVASEVNLAPLLGGAKAPGSGEAETEKVVMEQDQATALLNEATSLLKTLRAMKSVKIKQLVHEDPSTTAASRYALLGGGTTHALRQAEDWEYEGMRPRVVELAQGVATLFQHPSHEAIQLSTKLIRSFL